MKKRLIAITIALAMITSMTACGSNKTSDTATPTDAVEAIVETTTDEPEVTEVAEADTEVTETTEETTTEASETDDRTVTAGATVTGAAATDAATETTTETASAKSENSTQSANTSSTGTTESAKKPAATEITTEKPASTETTKKTTTEATKKTTEATTTHTHNWTPVYKTVVDQEAYDEKVPTGEYYTKLEMHKYGLAIVNTGDPFNNLQYAGNCGTDNKYIDITGWTQEQRTAYEKEHNLYPLSSCYVDYIEVPDYDNPIYETVHHDAVTHQEVDYYKCSCGATKAAK